MISRRSVLAAAGAFALAPRFGAAHEVIGPDALIAAARARANRPYRDPQVVLAPPFDQLDYDSYRGVRPVRGKAARLPVGAQFRADLLPPGWLFRTPVAIGLPGHDTGFAPDLFSYDPALIDLPDTWPDIAQMGFSGLRLLHPLNRPDRWDEVLVLQGASYFRALAQGTVYGKSARAFSLGTGGAGPEELPVTEEIHVFAAHDSVDFGCLVDSPRASAALIATLEPGRVTRMACSLHLFPRETLHDVGIAPLTSMFQHSALGPARIDDFRPAVHDSDVLVMDNGAGNRLWRPLANPADVQMSAFQDDGPRGFGLLQGPTDFAAFRDAEAQYHRRPSAWVRPRGNWGKGAVMLLETPQRTSLPTISWPSGDRTPPLPPARTGSTMIWIGCRRGRLRCQIRATRCGWPIWPLGWSPIAGPRGYSCSIWTGCRTKASRPILNRGRALQSAE